MLYVTGTKYHIYVTIYDHTITCHNIEGLKIIMLYSIYYIY